MWSERGTCRHTALQPRPAPCESARCPVPPLDRLLPPSPPSAECCSGSPCHVPANCGTVLGLTGLVGLRPHAQAPRAAGLQPHGLWIVPLLDPPSSGEGGVLERTQGVRLRAQTFGFFAAVKFQKKAGEKESDFSYNQVSNLKVEKSCHLIVMLI